MTSRHVAPGRDRVAVDIATTARFGFAFKGVSVLSHGTES